MTTEIEVVPLFSIHVPEDRARNLDPNWVDALAAMIAAQGLLEPIVVRRAGRKAADQYGACYQLVAGHHRLKALQKLQRAEVVVVVTENEDDDRARVDEVMENLGRQELKALDRCHHLYELKKVWERMHPETAHGKASPKSPKRSLSSEGLEIFGFAKATAEKIGLSQTAIKRDVAIWSNLSQPSRLRLACMPLADKMTELKALAEQKPPRQAAILDLILDPAHPDIQNVAEAIFHLDNGMTPDPIQKRFMAVSKSVGALDDQTFDHVIAAHEERVIASLKRRGRI